MVTREEIRWGYLMLFGREPEGEEAYQTHAVLADLAALRRVLIQSPEGLARLRADMRIAASTYDFDYFRPLLIFVHMEKTAGTSLYAMLAAHYGAVRSSPPHLAFLPELTLGELNQYDFVSGHFSFQEAMALPRSFKRCITMFREPFARLISFYRFHRAHPVGQDGDVITRLAQKLGPVEFFRHPSIRCSHRTDNLYLRTFGPIPNASRKCTAKTVSAALELATKRVASLDALGLTKDMDGSARLIGASLGIDILADMPRLHVTDSFHAGMPGFAPVGEIAMSGKLRLAMMPLVRYDLTLYKYAERLFRQRLAALDRDTACVGAGLAPSSNMQLKRWITWSRSWTKQLAPKLIRHD